ncbi:MAG: alginate export family protein [Thermoanaerobaculia bacterium]|nr:alginate export family protein [Thermoanaerobaculia bacterium]
MRKAASIFLVFCSFGSIVAIAEESAVKPLLDARFRFEDFATPSANSLRDRTYSFSSLRVRGGVEAKAGAWTLRGLGQASAIRTLPVDGAFGAGPVYFGTDFDDQPDQLGLLELSATYKSERGRVTLGRQGYIDGFERATGNANLDWVKRRRVAERLVGNLDFTVVGRRFDGASASLAVGKDQLDLFAFQPTKGAFRFEGALETLDKLQVFGASWTSGFGAWLPKSEVRLFAQQYVDDRAAFQSALGGHVEITTLGGSILAGDAVHDVLLWVAVQDGDYGSRDHAAWAVVAELGHRFTGVHGEPGLHLGFEQASGDDGDRDHGSFWNGLPTNHKFYGSLDYFAFSNLRDIYLELRWAPRKDLKLLAAVHDFSLVETRDAWYGGSGAFGARDAAFAARRPAGGFTSSDLGRELDLDLVWSGPKKLELRLGAGFFQGGDAVEQFAPVEADGYWGNVEISWSL